MESDGKVWWIPIGYWLPVLEHKLNSIADWFMALGYCAFARGGDGLVPV